MSKIGIIIQREFNTRVRKRSFIVTTIVTPILMVGLMAAPALLSMVKTGKTKDVLVVDRTGTLAANLENDARISFTVLPEAEAADVSPAGLNGRSKEMYGFLFIGSDALANPGDIQLYTRESVTLDAESEIAGRLKRVIEAERLKAYDIDSLPQIMKAIKADVKIQSFQIDDSGSEKESSGMLAMISAYMFAFLIYMFVFMYGAMVMNGVVEEKSSKVLEVMVSSVRPYELMMGKILGIAAVAVTQFAIWMVLIAALGGIVSQFLPSEVAAGMAQTAAQAGSMGPDAAAALRGATDIGFLAKMFGGFVLYFIGGYLLYAAMFAAIGSATDNVADTQQLQLPVTIPLILAVVVMLSVLNDPNGSIAFWFSMIPLTSPVIMMARLPYGVPAWEVALSLALLYGSFCAMVWLAGKVYRVGIFMYGKKPTWKELFKWMKYKY